MTARPPLTIAQRLVLLIAASGTVIERDRFIPAGIYRSLVHPHRMLRQVGGGYVITTEGRMELGQQFDDTMLEAAE